MYEYPRSFSRFPSLSLYLSLCSPTLTHRKLGILYVPISPYLLQWRGGVYSSASEKQRRENLAFFFFFSHSQLHQITRLYKRYAKQTNKRQEDKLICLMAILWKASNLSNGHGWFGESNFLLPTRPNISQTKKLCIFSRFTSRLWALSICKPAYSKVFIVAL